MQKRRKIASLETCDTRQTPLSPLFRASPDKRSGGPTDRRGKVSDSKISLIRTDGKNFLENRRTRIEGLCRRECLSGGPVRHLRGQVTDALRTP